MTHNGFQFICVLGEHEAAWLIVVERSQLHTGLRSVDYVNAGANQEEIKISQLCYCPGHLDCCV